MTNCFWILPEATMKVFFGNIKYQVSLLRQITIPTGEQQLEGGHWWGQVWGTVCESEMYDKLLLKNLNSSRQPKVRQLSLPKSEILLGLVSFLLHTKSRDAQIISKSWITDKFSDTLENKAGSPYFVKQVPNLWKAKMPSLPPTLV